MLPTLNSKSTASPLFVRQEEGQLARSLCAPVPWPAHPVHGFCFADRARGVPQSCCSMSSGQTPPLSRLTTHPGDPLPPRVPPAAPTHPWGAREGCYGLRRDLPGSGGAEPTAGCTRLVPTSPTTTWGGAGRASAGRHREEMCCCWRNFKLGKSWGPSPRPSGDGALAWPCCSTSEPQTQCESPIPATPDISGPCGWQCGELPSPSQEGLSPSHCSSGNTRWLQGSQVWGQALSIPLLLPHSWLLSPDPHSITQWHSALAG